jgi:hypothetical protein
MILGNHRHIGGHAFRKNPGVCEMASFRMENVKKEIASGAAKVY